MSARVRLVLGCAPPECVELHPAHGEYACSASVRAHLAAEGRVPDEVLLHLHAYELVERLRASAELGAERCAALLWPPCLFAAAGIEEHTWEELASLLPELAISSRVPALEEVEAERLRLGLPAFDTAAYRRALARAAEEGAWMRRYAPPAGFAGEPERRTAAAVLLRAGCVLLERRPPDARVTPGVWDLPGGHQEAGETADAALARELREELGVEVGAARLALELDACEPPDGRRYRHAIFLVESCGGEPRAREGQQHLRWATPEEALRLADLNPPTGWALQELLESGQLGSDAAPRSQRST
jgi:mutator protein MutT